METTMQAATQKKRYESINMKEITATRTLSGCHKKARYNNQNKPNSKNLKGLTVGIG
jgi:hypothetical protein